jgi:hypothetical protein
MPNVDCSVRYRRVESITSKYANCGDAPSCGTRLPIRFGSPRIRCVNTPPTCSVWKSDANGFKRRRSQIYARVPCRITDGTALLAGRSSSNSFVRQCRQRLQHPAASRPSPQQFENGTESVPSPARVHVANKVALRRAVHFAKPKPAACVVDVLFRRATASSGCPTTLRRRHSSWHVSC